ncbi:MAG: hypothetical protein JST55_04440 [Bacteroidetes bacterium]|nr:hypothetical protein [Bacteroidota bacterium]
MDLNTRRTTPVYNQMGHIFLVQYWLGLSEFIDIYGVEKGKDMFKIFDEKKRNLLDYLFTGDIGDSNRELMFDYAEKQIKMNKERQKKEKLF